MKSLRHLVIKNQILGLVLFFYPYLFAYQAVVIKPVIDCCSEKIIPPADISVQDVYHAFPHCWHTSKSECPRDIQLLFNQRVEVIQEDGEQARCVLPHLLVNTSGLNHTLQPLIAWTLKANLIRLANLPVQYQLTIPPAIQAQTFKSSDNSILTITMPWYNPIDHQVYSAGTRFVRLFNDTTTAYAVAWYQTTTNTIQTLILDRSICYVHGQRSMPDRQHDMLAIIKRWVTCGWIIPYVWGGCSIGQATSGTHTLQDISTMGARAKGWNWAPATTPPFHGVDCSALIVLAAHIVELPYFYRNTTTLETHLRPLSPGESVEDGDLIWIPGHVVIIDKTNQAIIESRGYGITAGTLCCRSIAECFNNFCSVDDITHAFFAGNSSEYKKRDGTLYITPFKILKFASIYDKHSAKQGSL